MTFGEFIFWAGLVLVGFVGSALFSGLETGSYSLNRVRLHLHAQQRRRAAVTLYNLIRQPTVLLTTLLIGNNIANQIGTAGLAVILAAQGFGEWQAIILNVVIVTPLLFIFGETLPKDLFAAHAERLMYRLTPVLTISRWLFTCLGLTPLISAVSSGMMKLLGSQGEFQPTHPKRQVEYLMKEGVGYGLLSDDQTAIMSRIIRMTDQPVDMRMRPWREVKTLKIDDNPGVLWQLADGSKRSRYPVIASSGMVVGVVNLFDALLHTKAACPPISELMTSAVLLPRSTPQYKALKVMQERGVSLAVVAGAHDEPVGVVSIKDLIEPITGSLAGW